MLMLGYGSSLLQALASLGKSWTWGGGGGGGDSGWGGIPQGCPSSMMFIVEGVEPKLYADNLKCVSLGTLTYSCVLLGLLLAMSCW